MRRNFKWGNYDEKGRECQTCKIYKLYEEYHKHSSCPKGYNTVCKECRKKVSKRYWETLPIERKTIQRLKSRCIEQNIDFDLEIEDINIPEKCPVFGVEFIEGDVDYSASIDRIDPTKGYVKNNMQVLSNKANRMKSNATKEELLLFTKWITESGVCEI